MQCHIEFNKECDPTKVIFDIVEFDVYDFNSSAAYVIL